MKLFSRSLSAILFMSLLWVVPYIFIQHSYAMEAVIIEEGISRLGLGLEETAARGMAEAAEEAFGRVTGAELESAGAGIRGALDTSLEKGLANLKEEIGALKSAGKELTPENLKSAATKAFGDQKSIFSKDVEGIFKEQGGFSPAQKSALKSVLPETSFKGEPIADPLAEKGISSDLEKFSPVDKDTNKALVLEEEARGNPDLEKGVASNQKARAAQSEAEVSAAQKKFNAAQEKFDKATTIAEKREAGEELSQARNELNESGKLKAADDNLTYKQKWQEAKSERMDKLNANKQAEKELGDAKTARKALDNDPNATAEQKVAADKTVTEKQGAAEKAGRELKAADEALVKQENELMENSSMWGNPRKGPLISREHIEITGSRMGRSSWDALTGTPKWIGSKVWGTVTGALDQMLIALWFTVPNMVIEAYNTAQAKKKLLETQKKYQQWGGMWLKIPDFFINENEPANSLHIYVGVPNDGFPITEEFLKTANYFVVKSDYAPWGSSSIFDSVSAMVHLNTGYVFVSDGQPADPDEPTMPFGEMAKDQAGLIGHLDDLSGKAGTGLKTEGVQYYVDSYEAGYKGSHLVATLFKSKGEPGSEQELTLEMMPPILVPTFNALKGGTNFGTDNAGKPLYLVEAFKGFNKSDQDNGKQLMEALTGAPLDDPSNEAADDDNYVLQGVYIYQTKDTPIVDLVKKQISANDPQGQMLRDAVTDYVVMLNRDNKVVPLMTPQPMVLPPGSKDSAFVHYALNPRADKMKSLIDGGSKAYDAHGSTEDASIPDNLTALPKIATQIKAMQTFFDTKIKYGPFTFGGTTLTIDKPLADANVFVYKAAGFLEGGFDDYLIAVEAVKDEKIGKTVLAVTSLPSNGIAWFVSLVTSRFYDKNLQPFAPPIAPEKDYYITKDNTVATGMPSDSSLPQSKAPLYTLFVEGPYNPSPKPAKFTGNLPVGPYWALDDTSLFYLQGVSPVSAGLKQLNQSSLIAIIKDMHTKWVAVLDISDPGALSKKMGPFDFVTGGVEPIRLRAYNPSAIKLGYYVYTSSRYPDEFLVLSKNADGTQGVGEEFNGQQYAISLSNGNVYDAQANGNAIKPINNPIVLTKNLGLTNAGVDARIANEQKILDAAKKSAKGDSKKIASLDAQIAALPSIKKRCTKLFLILGNHKLHSIIRYAIYYIAIISSLQDANYICRKIRILQDNIFMPMLPALVILLIVMEMKYQTW